MNGATHVVGGVTAAVVLGYTRPVELAAVVIASLFPDIDRQNSLLGRFIPLLPSFLERVLGKRTLTHSFLFGVIVAALLRLHGWGLWIPFAIGFGSHLTLDIITGKVALLWPLPIRLGVPLIGIPPVFVETVAIALWGGWMVVDGYQHFLIF